MVKKGHKYVTLLQINVPEVMILSQKLIYFEKGGNLIAQIIDPYEVMFIFADVNAA